MKKILLLAALLSSATLMAGTVGEQQARQKAESLLGKSVQVAASSRRLAPQEVPAYYLFNAEDGKGFALIAAEDDLASVLGYSLQGSASEEQMPDALALLLNAYQQYVSDYRNGQAEAPKAIVRAARGVSAGPLVKTEWGQNAPYNNLCPLVGNKSSLSGCVATAMAQVLKFWQWPVTGTGYGSATCNNEVVHGSLEHTYDWENMMNTTSENLASETSSAAVAQLLYDCGLATNMAYGTDGSGTPNSLTKRALCQNFGYIPTTLRTYSLSCFETNDDFLEVVFNEIDNGRPALYSAHDATDGGGHAFVIDGYDEQGRMHVNWGWNGSFNGYFDVTAMNPGSYKYVINQSLIAGIEPARNGETGELIEFPLMSNPPTCSQTGSITKTTTFNILVGNISNPNGLAHTWSLSVGIFDVKNEMLGEVKTGRVPSLSLNPGYYHPGDFGNITCKVNGDYPDGDYALRVMFKEKGQEDWILPDMAGGLKNNAVYINLSGNRINFTDGSAYNEAFKTAGMAPVITSQPTDENNTLYDLQGRKVDTPRKGIYIKNGHKVVY